MRAWIVGAALICSSTVYAQEQNWTPGNPPPCTDERYKKRILTRYAEWEKMPDREGRKIVSSGAVKEVGVRPLKLGAFAVAPPGFNATGRFCETELLLDNGEKEVLFYRFGVIVEGHGKKPYVQTDYCSTRHDTFKDSCQRFRER